MRRSSLLMALLVTGCSTAGPAPTDVPPPTPLITFGTPAPVPTVGEATATPVVSLAPSPTAAPATALSTAAPASAPSGESFSDPEGHYEMVIGEDWAVGESSQLQSIGLPETAEFWFVAPSRAPGANVNVLTEATPVTLDDYVAFSERSLPQVIAGFQHISSRRVTGSGGSQLAILEYTGTASGEHLHILQVVMVGGGQAVIATFATDPDSFAGLRPEVEPYLLTLTTP